MIRSISTVEEAIAFLEEFSGQESAKVQLNAELKTLSIEIEGPLFKGTLSGCWHRSNIDHLCRLNFDQGLLSAV